MPTADKPLTHEFVKAIKPPAKGTIDWFDPKLSGFSVRVSAGGTKSWSFMYRVKGEKARPRLIIGRVAIMSLADARAIATAWSAMAQQGEDPREHVKPKAVPKPDVAVKPAGLTVNEMIDRYIEDYGKPQHRDSTKQNVVDYMRRVRKALGDRQAASITRVEVKAFLRSIESASSSNATMRILRGIYNWAIDEEVVDHNPCARIKQIPVASRAVYLTDAKIKALWQACDEMRPETAARVRLRLLTGQRSSEVDAMAWSEVDFDEALWTIPAARVKNKQTHYVPLSQPVIDILKAAPRLKGAPYVFPSPTDRSVPVARGNYLAGRLKAIAGFDDFRLHDLRRTVSTGMSGLGIPQEHIDAVLNHKKTGVSGTYNRHTYGAEKVAALTLWANHVMALVGTKTETNR